MHDLLAIAFWIPTNLAISLFFLAKTLPKIYLFQSLALETNTEMASARLTCCPDQASLTIPGKSLWLSHIDWNLKGLFRSSLMEGFNLSNKGQWSEFTLAKCVTLASSKKAFQAELAQHLSNLHWIKSSTPLLFLGLRTQGQAYGMCPYSLGWLLPVSG